MRVALGFSVLSEPFLPVAFGFVHPRIEPLPRPLALAGGKCPAAQQEADSDNDHDFHCVPPLFPWIDPTDFSACLKTRSKRESFAVTGSD